MIQPTIRLVPLLSALAWPLLLPAQVSVRENNRSITHTCTPDEPISVLGNNNSLQFSGPCGAVSVAGNNNKVALETVRTISAPGNDNRITWTTGKPEISNPGSRNQIGSGSATATARSRSGAHVSKGNVSDGAGNSVRTNADGSTTVTDAAGNTVSTQPH